MGVDSERECRGGSGIVPQFFNQSLESVALHSFLTCKSVFAKFVSAKLGNKFLRPRVVVLVSRGPLLIAERAPFAHGYAKAGLRTWKTQGKGQLAFLSVMYRSSITLRRATHSPGC